MPALAHHLPGKRRAGRLLSPLDGIPIAVVKDSSGAVHALGDTCTHGEISLSEGFVEEDAIECWAHGSKFDLATGAPRNFPAYEPVPVFAVTITNGDIFVDPTPIPKP